MKKNSQDPHCRNQMLDSGSLEHNIYYFQMYTNRKRIWKLSQELYIPRAKVWAKDVQYFPSSDMWYTEKGNSCIAFKNFD